jgi:hypothetical protein
MGHQLQPFLVGDCGSSELPLHHQVIRILEQSSAVVQLLAQVALRASTAETEETARLLSEYTAQLEAVFSRMEAGGLSPAEIAELRKSMNQ